MNFLADLLTPKHAGLLQDPQMVSDGGPRERGRMHDLRDAELLLRVEQQQHPLPVRITEGSEEASEPPSSKSSALKKILRFKSRQPVEEGTPTHPEVDSAEVRPSDLPKNYGRTPF